VPSAKVAINIDPAEIIVSALDFIIFLHSSCGFYVGDKGSRHDKSTVCGPK
jgi:hypothetical protein